MRGPGKTTSAKAPPLDSSILPVQIAAALGIQPRRFDNPFVNRVSNDLGKIRW